LFTNRGNWRFRLAAIERRVARGRRAAQQERRVIVTKRESGPERRAWVKQDSDFNDLRSHPRYQRMIEMMDKGEL